jgi:hypothetical protein
MPYTTGPFPLLKEPPKMRLSLTSALLFLQLLHNSAQAGDTFLHWQTRCSRCSLPGWNYQVTDDTPVAVLVSEPAISAAGSTSFTFDKLTAGPLQLSQISALANSGNPAPAFSATLRHTGGNTGLLAGGQAIIRVEGLAATAGTPDRGVVVCAAEQTVWVRRGIPLTIDLALNSATKNLHSGTQIERVRVYLQYRPSR